MADSRPAPCSALALDLGPLVVLVGALTLFVAGLPLCSALRTTSRNPGLVRCFPVSPTSVRVACLAVPTAVAVLGSVAALPAVRTDRDRWRSRCCSPPGC